MTVEEIFNKYYPVRDCSDAVSPCIREILLKHSRSVADLALEINEKKNLGLSPLLVREAAMLHDIGVGLTHAPSIGCHGMHPYIMHGILGADILRAHHFPEEYARVAERHTGVGIYPEDIASQNLPLPSDRILYPQTLLERLICFADKFYSKSGNMERKTLERVRQSIENRSPASLRKFDLLYDEFSLIT